MRLATIEKLCCPFDKAELELTTIAQEQGENITEGFLTCDACKRIYPIVKGVPIMSPDEYREFRLELPLLAKWKHHLKGRVYDNFRLLPLGSDDLENRFI